MDVAIADVAKVKGIAPRAAKTDGIDARVLAQLARRDLVPEIWLPTPSVRAELERVRFRLHFAGEPDVGTAYEPRPALRVALDALGEPYASEIARDADLEVRE